MAALLPTLVATCFALSVGLLTPLVLIERPLWGLFWDVASANIKDTDARRIHSAIQVLAQAGGSIVLAAYGSSGTVLAVIQAWHYGFYWATVVCAMIAIVYNMYALWNREAVVKPYVKGTHLEDSELRATIRKIVNFHFLGFVVFTVILLVQLVFVIGR